MIIGAFYWAMVFFGGIVVLVSGLGLADELQRQPLRPGWIVFAVAFGLFGAALATYSARNLRRGYGGFYAVKAGPLFKTTGMARGGCLFIVLVVGACMLLYGPVAAIQLPSMTPDDQFAMGIGAAVSSFLGLLMVTFSGLLLWLPRGRRNSANRGAGEQGHTDEREPDRRGSPERESLP